MPEEDLKMKFKVGQQVNLQGFTSSSLIKEEGVKFALDNFTSSETGGKVPVLFEITFKGNHQFFSLNSSELSAYPSEQEILIQEGVKFTIVDVCQ